MSSSWRSSVLLVAGVLCGMAVTVMLSRVVQLSAADSSSSSPRQHAQQQALGSAAGLFLSDAQQSAVIGHLRHEGRLERLRKERQELQQRLRSLEQEIGRLSSGVLLLPSHNASSPVSQPSPSSPPASDAPASASTGSSCKYSFKVYVYPIPLTLKSVSISEEARRNRTLHVCQKCILEQFALEYIVYDFFTQFCGRTHNPDEADFFYLPLVRDAEYRTALERGGPHSRTPSETEQALLDIMEKNDATRWKAVFQVTEKYWQRHHGGDHIIVMPAPVTNLRHESSMRGFYHYMSHLHPPIFIGVEYSRQFVQEYPICAAKKNIVVPYPTTDPDLYNGKLLHYKGTRSHLLYYAGGLHGDCIEVRKAMKVLLRNSTRLSNVLPGVKSGQAEREHGFLEATFCPVPIGDSPSSKRMYDVLNFGCIPVVLSDDLVWAFSDQVGGPLKHSSFAIHVPQSVVHFTAARTLRKFESQRDHFGILPVSGLRLYDLLQESVSKGEEYENGQYVNPLVQILRKIPQKDIEFLEKNGQYAASQYRFYAVNASASEIVTAVHVFPNGGAIDQIALALSQRKAVGIANLTTDCIQEKNGRKHQYVSRYSCDVDREGSLL